MRVVIQRVSSAKVTVDGRIAGEIGLGLLVLLGIESCDNADDSAWLTRKILSLRIFPDEGAHMNRSIREASGEILLVSQFTLHASTAKGARPSFHAAAAPAAARPLYEAFAAQLADGLGKPISTGEFGAMMQVSLTNDGPVTLLIDSRRRE